MPACDRADRSSQCDIVVRTAPSALYWCGQVMFDRRGNQLGDNNGLYVRERTMVCIKIPRCDTNEGATEGGAIEVTATSELIGRCVSERTKVVL